MRYAIYGAASAGLVRRVLRRVQESARPRPDWVRTNYRQHEVTLAGGVVTGASLTALGVPVALIDPRVGAAQCLAAGSGLLLGYFDDTRGREDARKGLKGHLGALAHGELTTGAAKILGIGAGAGLAAAVAAADKRGGRAVAMWAVDSAVIAGAANLANLLDLRPGRLLKVAALALAPYALAAPSDSGRMLAGAAAALSVLQLPGDLSETHMLGDTGANALGATWGLVAVCCGAPRTRVAQLGAIVGLILASERVSFSRVIDATPPLRWLDRLGRLD